MKIEEYNIKTGKTIEKETADQPIIFKDFQNELIQNIDNKTDNIFMKGFDFDNNKFSLSAEAQLNWISLKIIKIQNEFPVNGLQIATKNNGAYLLQKEKLLDFLIAYYNALKTIYGDGLIEKDKVCKYTNINELKTYKDERK